MIDPILRKMVYDVLIGEDSEPFNLWFVLPNGFYLGRVLSLEDKIHLNAENALESDGDYRYYLISTAEKAGRRLVPPPPDITHFEIASVLYFSGQCYYHINRMTVSLDSICAWGFGNLPIPVASPSGEE